MIRLRHLVPAAALAALAAGCGDGGAGGVKDPPGKPARSAEVLARGKASYETNCAKCHGAEGKGDGASAGLSLPKPRDFTLKKFRYVTTESKLPSEDDLFRMVSKGSAGTQMLGFEGTVSEYERWALVYRVQELAGLGTEAQAAYKVPAAPAPAKGDARLGAQLYDKNCSKCHGDKADGVTPLAATLKDEKGNPLQPRNLLADAFRGGEEPERIWLRIKLGLPGSPMEPPDGYPEMSDDEIWVLVRHIQGLRGKK